MRRSSVLTPQVRAHAASSACSASMNAAVPPVLCAEATACSARVVLPEASGPKISMTRPRGKPPTPRAMSTASEPVEIASIFSPALAPSFMIEPFPNCSLDFFFLFLSLASPRPVGIGPSINPAGSCAGLVEHSVTGAARLSSVPARPRRVSARVATRTGDGGETSLFGKERVRKTDPRVEALGDLDETQAVLGLARSLAPRSSLGRELLELQRGLYLVMAEVATPRSGLGRLKERLDGAAVARLEEVLETVKKRTPIEGRFVIPGENRIAASLDHARTVARRAERHVVECVDEGYVSGEDLLPWLNRLSDVLFVLARASERAPHRRA